MLHLSFLSDTAGDSGAPLIPEVFPGLCQHKEGSIALCPARGGSAHTIWLPSWFGLYGICPLTNRLPSPWTRDLPQKWRLLSTSRYKDSVTGPSSFCRYTDYASYSHFHMKIWPSFLTWCITNGQSTFYSQGGRWLFMIFFEDNNQKRCPPLPYPWR